MKYKATIIMVTEVEVEAPDHLNDYDVQDNLKWSAEAGYMSFNSQLINPYETLRARDAIVTIAEVA